MVKPVCAARRIATDDVLTGLGLHLFISPEVLGLNPLIVGTARASSTPSRQCRPQHAHDALLFGNPELASCQEYDVDMR